MTNYKITNIRIDDEKEMVAFYEFEIGQPCAQKFPFPTELSVMQQWGQEKADWFFQREEELKRMMENINPNLVEGFVEKRIEDMQNMPLDTDTENTLETSSIFDNENNVDNLSNDISSYSSNSTSTQATTQNTENTSTSTTSSIDNISNSTSTPATDALTIPSLETSSTASTTPLITPAPSVSAENISSTTPEVTN